MFVGDGKHPLDRQFRVGRFFGIPLDLHIILLIYIGFEVLMTVLSASPTRLILPIVLFFSVYLHELGHALSSAHFGKRPHRIVLHLFGGVAEVPPGLGHKQQMWVIAWGPLVSGALALIGLAAYFPLAIIPYAGAFALWFFFINLVLFLFNVLPIYPLDGGQFVRQWVSLRKGKQYAIRKTLPWSVVTIAVAGLAGLVFKQIGSFTFIIALFLIFINYYEIKRWQHLFTGPKGFWGQLLPGSGGFSFHFFDRIYVKRHRKKAEELMRRADEIGIHDLNPQDRRILEKYLDAKLRIREGSIKKTNPKRNEWLN